MNRLRIGAIGAAMLLPLGLGMGTVSASAATTHKGACTPSPQVLKAVAVRVHGLSTRQVQNATTIINAAKPFKIPERGQTIAVMTALEASSLGQPTKQQAPASGTLGLFGPEFNDQSAVPLDVGSASQNFYRELKKVKGWENMPPTLAAHAAEHNLDPDVYTPFWQRAVTIVNALTSGTGLAGLANLAARAQEVADCLAATTHGNFAVDATTPYVGPIAPTVLISRAEDMATNGGSNWHDLCQRFVAVLAGRSNSGYSTALDAWQTFEAQGVAHLVTAPDGVSPPVGAWLYYRDSTNPAGHVVTYLGGGKIASTDVFSYGRVGVGPASAITDGPWHMQYLGWAAPWGNE